MAECGLHYAWKNGLYDPLSLTTGDGELIQVVDPGLENTDAGPDFFNAKIRIGDVMLAGNVEVHEKASDWYRHGHHKDRSYDTVILHVVGESDAVVRETTGKVIPQFELKLSQKLQEGISWLLSRETPIPCLGLLEEIEGTELRQWMEQLRQERLRRKVEDVMKLLSQYKDDWNELFYILLTRNFGFGTNSDAFELLAKSIPYRYILRHRGDVRQLEALFLGQAGMAGEGGEYRFLRHKFALVPLEGSLFKNLRMRPGNFPRHRLLQLASLWTKYDTLFSRMLDATTPQEMKRCLSTDPPLGEGSLNNLLINTVVPVLMAYGSVRARELYRQRGLALLTALPAEKNKIVTMFTQAGLQVHNAGDTQALVQLKKDYCDAKKCLYCKIGVYLSLPNARTCRQ
ncbi:MAG: DUF2851 family protein [Tannerellaceae bacterium]|nr:DUF2851 family protein [Tannerellaceae bacterium]